MMVLNYVIAVMLFVLSLYCLLLKRNLIKMIIGLGIMSDGIHLFLISLGYRAGGVAPILTEPSNPSLLKAAVDPIPQALVLTSIVINICIIALALSIAIHLYREYGTLNPFEIRRLKG
ncbi:MAG: cation:proton antiporter [Hadesarchaea archaeon YNP_N21]|jgi:multicomponent Na+:H+ antiporter subunit C|nr:MAG: cation:proton antiporter [Hadesarchaea archaeon YNP_N21]